MLGEAYDSIHEWLEKEPLPSEEAAEIKRIKQQIETKKAIHQALLDEILFSDNCLLVDKAASTLKILVREQRGQNDSRIDAEKSKVTCDSLAIWFWKFDREIAVKFDLEIERKMGVQNDIQDQALEDENKRVGVKTENSYLRLIYALSKALAGGSLTGVKNKDAEIIYTALAAKGIECPIGQKTLAKYLGEASEL